MVVILYAAVSLLHKSSSTILSTVKNVIYVLDRLIYAFPYWCVISAQ